MKRALVAALALACSAGFAAETATSPLRVGLQAGATMGTLSNATLDGVPAGVNVAKKSRTGLAAGVNVDYWLADMIWAQAEIMYFQHGVKFDATGAATGKSTLKYDVIKIPLLAKFLYPVAPGFKIGAVAGPSFEVRMSAKQKTEITAPIVSTTEDDLKDDTKSFLIGLDAGLATELEVSPTIAAFLDVRYSYSFTKIAKTGGANSKFSDIYALVGARFTL